MNSRIAPHVRIAIFAACLIPLMAPVSWANGISEAAGNIGAHLGYAKTQDAEEGNYLFGGHLELGLAPWLGVQGAVDYRSEEAFRPPNASLTDESVKIKTVPMTISGRLYIPQPSGFSPFLVGGAGWYRMIYDMPESWELLGIEDQTRTSFGWHAGAGLRIPLSQRTSLYGEGRFIFLDPDRDFGPEVRDELKDIDYDSTYLSGGINFHF